MAHLQADDVNPHHVRIFKAGPGGDANASAAGSSGGSGGELGSGDGVGSGGGGGGGEGKRAKRRSSMRQVHIIHIRIRKHTTPAARVRAHVRNACVCIPHVCVFNQMIILGGQMMILG